MDSTTDVAELMDSISDSASESDPEGSCDQFASYERSSIRADILAVIKHYAESKIKPPFSAADMVVMALICGTKHDMDTEEIIEWIVLQFKYYNVKAVKQYACCSNLPEDNQETADMVVPEFWEVFSKWEVPLIGALADDDNNIEDLRLSVSPRAGRVYLQRWMEPERKDTFPFLKLPAELRNTIYEMVFAFPRSGIDIDRLVHGRSCRPCLLRRVDDRPGEQTADAELEGPPLRIVLALLSVNMQIHKEAVPYFYRDNFFYADGAQCFVNFMTKTSESRLQHLSHVKFPYHAACSTSQDLKKLPRALEVLSRTKKLQRLTIDACDDNWYRLQAESRRALGRTTKFTKVEQFTGMQELAVAASKAGLLDFTGDGPQIEAYVRAEVEKFKANGGQEVKTRKRRRVKKNAADMEKVRVEGAEDEEAEPKKKAKTKA